MSGSKKIISAFFWAWHSLTIIRLLDYWPLKRINMLMIVDVSFSSFLTCRTLQFNFLQNMLYILITKWLLKTLAMAGNIQKGKLTLNFRAKVFNLRSSSVCQIARCSNSRKNGLSASLCLWLLFNFHSLTYDHGKCTINGWKRNVWIEGFQIQLW